MQISAIVLGLMAIVLTVHGSSIAQKSVSAEPWSSEEVDTSGKEMGEEFELLVLFDKYSSVLNSIAQNIDGIRNVLDKFGGPEAALQFVSHDLKQFLHRLEKDEKAEQTQGQNSATTPQTAQASQRSMKELLARLMKIAKQ
ncbi:uncharacterized protein LOC132556067 [Ylistrum balloti]|uniref:uncharacterized protein LOC132556067 n=1 Tax=Ylistrum balloti TaxID=509963 RepID=UPI002905C6BF|nr:uncharacterized protein LOC132556067 [Ylistrum balloti]